MDIYRPSQNQKEIENKHFAFMEQLDSEDKILLGGPFVDAKGLVIILKATSKDEADRIMSQKPIILGKLFSIAEDHEMQISVAGS